jgi:hypothetical protein
MTILPVLEWSLFDASLTWPCSRIQYTGPDIDLGRRLALSGVQFLQIMAAGDHPFVIPSLQ